MIAKIVCFLTVLPILSYGMKFIVIGDWGDDNSDQYAVADAMSGWCAPTVWGPCEFIVGTGDNFYTFGVTSNSSERFNTTWRWVYDKPNIADLVWHQTLGNHDYGPFDDRELYQVEYGTTDPLWNMPWIWYDQGVLVGSDGASVHLIAVDTVSIVHTKHDWETQLVRLDEILAASTADWKILFGHDPPYAVGGHAPGSRTIRDLVVPLCNKYGVDVLFSGHEHNLEHLSSDNVTDYVISGSGGRALYDLDPAGVEIVEGWGLTVDYFGFHFGFVSMDVTKTSYTAKFVDETQTVRYSFTRTKARRADGAN